LTSILVRRSKLHGDIKCPPSKSYTHRAIIVGSLAEGCSRINNFLKSRDTLATISGCKSFGIELKCESGVISIRGKSKLDIPRNVIDVQNSGTTLRFLSAAAALANDGYTVLTGDESIRRRPMQPMLATLTQLGVPCFSTRRNGMAPIVVRGGGITGGNVTISGLISSQFISGLLISGIYSTNEIDIKVIDNQVSRPYIEATLATMRNFGVTVEHSSDYMRFRITPNIYSSANFNIPGDFSTGAILLAAGVLTADKIRVSGLNSSLPQGDSNIIEIIKVMGARIINDRQNNQVIVEHSEQLDGGEFDLSDSPDLLPVVSILAIKARSKVRIFGIEHTKYKETDRATIIISELRKLGVDCKSDDGDLIINPTKQLKNAILNPHDDHRLFMCFCIASMMTKKSKIYGAESVDVSFPDFISEMRNLGANINNVK
jgi:3-phosphoshikimate 1-carboxyvinyltransferase